MLPIVIDPAQVRIGLAAAGPAGDKRRAMLAEAGVVPVELAADAEDALAGLSVLYVAGIDPDASAALAARARARSILVNVEDVPALCDFHVPAAVRRGDLLLTVSSGGRAPGLVRHVRDWLAERFGQEWGGRVEAMGRLRARWRAEGVPPAAVAERTRAAAVDEGWLS